MTRKEALTILNLSSSANEEEIKHAYKVFARKYHPDANPNLSLEHKQISEENFKIIYEAYCYLTKNELSLEEYVKELLNELFTYAKYDRDKNYAKFLEPFANAVATVISQDFITNVLGLSEKNAIEQEFNKTRRKIRQIFENLKLDFYVQNYVDDNPIAINCNCSLGEFYEQLLQIANVYSRSIKFGRELEEEISKYSRFIGYDDVELLIRDTAIRNANIRAKNSNYNLLSSVLDKFNKEVKEIFDDYYAIINRINGLYGYFENSEQMLDSEKITLANLKRVEHSFKMGIPFAEVNTRLNAIDEQIELIEEEKRKLAKIKQNSYFINQIYGQINDRYHKRMQELNMFDNSDDIKSFNAILSKALELLSRVVAGDLLLETIPLFYNISFKNIEEDIKTLNCIVNYSLDLGKPELSGIYVLKELDIMSLFTGENSYTDFYVNRGLKDGAITIVSYGNREGQTMSYEDFEKKYISIEDFLKGCQYFGVTCKVWKDDGIILYGTDRYLCLVKGKIIFIQGSSASLSTEWEKGLEKDSMDIYAVIELIRKQLIEDEIIIDGSLKRTSKNSDN